MLALMLCSMLVILLHGANFAASCLEGKTKGRRMRHASSCVTLPLLLLLPQLAVGTMANANVVVEHSSGVGQPSVRQPPPPSDHVETSSGGAQAHGGSPAGLREGTPTPFGWSLECSDGSVHEGERL